MTDTTVLSKLMSPTKKGGKMASFLPSVHHAPYPYLKLAILDELDNPSPYQL